MSASIEDAIFDLLSKVEPGKTVAPEDVARAVDAETWRRLLGQVRGTAKGLARQGRLVVTRHGKPANPEKLKGVYRLRLPLEGDVIPSAAPDAETPRDVED